MKTIKIVFLVLMTSFLGIIFSTLAFAEGTRLTPQGVKFPDGTLQTTKATETGIPGPQGPPGPGCLGVYSNDGEYLGSLIDASFTSTEIFNPSLGKVFYISSFADTPGYADMYSSYYEFFTTTDCTGASYFSTGSGDNAVINPYMVKKHDGSFAAIGTPKDVTIKSVRGLQTSWECWPGEEPGNQWHELIPISASAIPFTLPVKLPLVFK